MMSEDTQIILQMAERITELQAENKQLRDEYTMSIGAYEAMSKLYAEKRQKLEAIRELTEKHGNELHPAQLPRPEGIFWEKIREVLGDE